MDNFWSGTATKTLAVSFKNITLFIDHIVMIEDVVDIHDKPNGCRILLSTGKVCDIPTMTRKEIVERISKT